MSTIPVQQAMLAAMEALSDDIVVTEALANELTQAAVTLSDDQPGARAIRDSAVRKRVKAIELRGQLAALREEYASQFRS